MDVKLKLKFLEVYNINSKIPLWLEIIHRFPNIDIVYLENLALSQTNLYQIVPNHIFDCDKITFDVFAKLYGKNDISISNSQLLDSLICIKWF